MDGELLSSSNSFSQSSSATAAETETQDTAAKRDSSVTQGQQWHKSTGTVWTEVVTPVPDRLLSTEEQVTLITESMTVSSTDQEKLLLLNKNTELRRVNKELMKLNEDWDQVYRSATLGLQHRLEALEMENTGLKQLNGRLLLRVEHQQGAKDYYEQALMQELKKNRELYEYITLLESRTQIPDRPKHAGNFRAAAKGPNLSPISHSSGHDPCSSPPNWRADSDRLGDHQQEVQDLKEQLGALRCQTQIYEEEYQTEHKDHKQTLEENRRLRRKREEMRQQVALLQEQLKVYEDDFRRERSDKQMLQRLLLKKGPQSKDPVLIHRCNNAAQPQGGDKRTQSAEKRKIHQPVCAQHPHRDTDRR